MSWRQQIEAVLCAIFLLASIAAVAIRTLVLDVVSLESETRLVNDQVSQPTRANRLNTTSRAKEPQSRLTRFSQSSSLEITSLGDEGSLWDEGPVYDLSR